MRRQSGHHAHSRRQIVLIAVCCIWLGLCCLIALRPALDVLTLYQPPGPARPLSGSARDAHSERVVLVVVNRLANHDLSEHSEPWRFAELRRRAAEGARGTARAVQPSGDAPTWVALLSGAGPDQSGIVDDTERHPLPVATLFEQAARAQKRSAFVAGPVAGRDRAGFGAPDQVITGRSSATTADAAVELLQTRTEPLVVVLLDAGRLQSGWPQQAAASIDAQIGAIAATLDPNRDTLIVTGDHGVLPDGSSGGHQNALLDVPLVLWGNMVVPGVIGTVDQRDIAPTIATLLGLPYSSVQGQPLLDALDLDDQQRADETVAVLSARLNPPPTFVTPASVAEATSRLQAAQVASTANDWLRSRIEAAQGLSALVPPAAALRYVTSPWFWSSAFPIVLLAIALLIGRFRRSLAFLVVPLAGLACYLALWVLIFFVLGGKSISLSAIYGEWGGNLTQIGLWSGLAFGAVSVGIALVRPSSDTVSPILHTGWSALLVLGCLGLIVVVYLVVAGLPAGRLPGLAGWAGLLIVLAQMAGLGIVAPLAMLLTATVDEIISRGR